MKAVIYQKKLKPYPLVVMSCEKPIPKEDEILIKVYAVSLNAADYRSIQMGLIPKKKIFGSDVSGVVIEVGALCQKFKVGDEVIGDLSAIGFGGLAEFAAGKEQVFILKPKSLGFEDAAALPISAVTALQALRNKGNVKEDQKVLIYGAGGGVGTFAVQLAKHFKCQVSAICGPNNIELIKKLNIEHVYNYHETKLKDIKDSFDLILAINGKEKLTTYQKKLKKKGTLVVVGGNLSFIFKTMFFGALLSLSGKKIKMLVAKSNPNDLEYLAELASQQIIKPVIERGGFT
jgi:NADPH:quinone reductase-like Zn-dependent oxidoreductase